MVAVQAAAAPRRGALVAQLSKSVAKARIEPGRARRNVDIPRFFSWPIPSRGAFATDLDTLPPRIVSKAPPTPSRQGIHPGAHRDRRRRRCWRGCAASSPRGAPEPGGAPTRRPAGKTHRFGRHSNTTRSAGPGLSAPAPRTLVVEGFRTRVPIPGELPPSPERPTSGSLRPSAVSARTRSSGSPTLASPPVRRQPLCNPTTLNTHPPTAWETSANSTPARRCCPCCA